MCNQCHSTSRLFHCLVLQNVQIMLTITRVSQTLVTMDKMLDRREGVKTDRSRYSVLQRLFDTLFSGKNMIQTRRTWTSDLAKVR